LLRFPKKTAWLGGKWPGFLQKNLKKPRAGWAKGVFFWGRFFRSNNPKAGLGMGAKRPPGPIGGVFSPPGRDKNPWGGQIFHRPPKGGGGGRLPVFPHQSVWGNGGS